MLDEVRHRIAAYLSAHQLAVISTAGAVGSCVLPVHYRSHGLELDCLLPRWADAAYYLEHNARVVLIVQAPDAHGLCWLEYRGRAQVATAPDWRGLMPTRHPTIAPEHLYRIIRVAPDRIDLIDQRQGWGARETLEL